ncbi:AraC family transcriptional regulator [Halarcobacter ebronensis]|uniref:AraC family transcriptional regulator n=1 Tax=Halarcobacter ebronensis TaxID=1462615 RepID=A0A4V1M034_9BACT|nr:AraC family transcriptional regulator [Halarcobacter ebronensis]QKF81191.1 transcriptional regulator, AraC family [Halarcobacter ebronensis]RXK03234.1 AraC family transcriptional regulator [Halarcobacter ebronensis]
MVKVSSVTFHYVLKALQANTKISIEEMLEVANLDKEIILRTDYQINSRKLSEIFKYCMEKSNDFSLSLKIGSSITYHSLGILGYLMLNADSLKDMIEKFNYYQNLISGFVKFHLELSEEYYKLSIYINENPSIPVPSFHAEVHLSAILSILSQIVDKKIVPDKTYFSGERVSHLDEYKKIFGERIFFDAGENSIFFNHRTLLTKVDNSNPAMLEYFKMQANKILDDMKESSCYSKVKREILKNIGENEISIEFIAQKLGMGTRTLQYSLKQENKKFRDALLSVRMNLANHYINNTKMDFSSIAFYLGYSEPSSFFRAYKNYFDKTPTQNLKLK